jgi:hypothetical protein
MKTLDSSQAVARNVRMKNTKRASREPMTTDSVETATWRNPHLETALANIASALGSEIREGKKISVKVMRAILDESDRQGLKCSESTVYRFLKKGYVESRADREVMWVISDLSNISRDLLGARPKADSPAKTKSKHPG